MMGNTTTLSQSGDSRLFQPRPPSGMWDEWQGQSLSPPPPVQGIEPEPVDFRLRMADPRPSVGADEAEAEMSRFLNSEGKARDNTAG